MDFLIGGIVGILIGAALGLTLGFMLTRLKSYSGTMRIIREDDKLVYSLELHDDPVLLEHMNEVVFKVETSD